MSSTGQAVLSAVASAENIEGASAYKATIPVLPLFRTVLACTDLSLTSRAAVMEAANLCKSVGGHLLLLHVCEYGSLSAGSEEGIEYVAELLKSENARLEALATEVRKMGVSVDAILEDGSASNVILNFIAERNIDLAVLGTHGASGLERMVCGSTAEEVLRKARCPVITVGPRSAKQRGGGAHGPVIFATDFHNDSNAAIRYAASLARERDAPLHCVHVLPLLMENEGSAPIIPHVMTEALRHLVTEHRINFENPVCVVTYGSEISHAIVDYAKEHKAQAIVLGIHRASWLAAHMGPHITYRIIVTAPCPVLTVLSDYVLSSPQTVACL